MVAARPARGGRTDRRLARASSVADLRALARRRSPRAIFDYVDGGAEGEVSMARARTAWDRVEFSPRVLQDVGTVDVTTSILGRPARLPLVLAPTGLTRAVHHSGEVGVARAAADAGVPYSLSTMSTTSIEDLVSAVPQADRWFQLYMWRDRAASTALMDRAAASGYRTLVLTVDVPVAGGRLRDQRNGFTVPPTLSARTMLDMARHPSWCASLLTTGPLTFASLSSSPGSIAGLIADMFDPAMTWDDLVWVRDRWPGSLVVKGVQRLDDAERATSAGVDAIVVSNHGGRQLDRSPAPVALLPRIRDRLQDSVELYVDGGVMSGADVAAAVGLGADAVLIGRAYLYGLMAGGPDGVHRVLELLHSELRRTLQLLGVRDLQALRAGAVTLALGG
jgi:L-lactate dehydrogenase (cytochrome)